MASRDKNDLHLIIGIAYQKAVLEYLTKYPNDPKPFITCTHRSNEEQNQLYNQKPKVTNAKAGESPHNYLPSLAFDIAFITVSKQLDWSNYLFKKFAEILIKIEPRMEWGGNWAGFKDAPHYQLKSWKSYLEHQLA